MGAMLVLYYLAVIFFVPGIILVIISEDRWRRFGAWMIVIAFFLFIVGLLIYSANYKYFEDRNSDYYRY